MSKLLSEDQKKSIDRLLGSDMRTPAEETIGDTVKKPFVFATKNMKSSKRRFLTTLKIFLKSCWHNPILELSEVKY